MSTLEYEKFISGDIPTADFVIMQGLSINVGLDDELRWVYPRKPIFGSAN